MNARGSVVFCLVVFSLLAQAKAAAPVDWLKTVAPEFEGKRFAPQLMMAPRLRHLWRSEEVEKVMTLAKRNGFDGIHIYVDTDWFSFEAENFEEIDSKELNIECWRRLENVRAHCVRDNLHLHVWIWGDVDNRLHPQVNWGQKSVVEQSVYREINNRFAGKSHITFGLGWDLKEFLSLEEAKWVKDRLRVPLSMRHPEGFYNPLAEIPSLQHRNPNDEDLVAFAQKYAAAPMIISEDRFRDRPWRKVTDGNIPMRRQMEIYRLCKTLGITAIYGLIRDSDEDQEFGSRDYPQEWRDYVFSL